MRKILSLGTLLLLAGSSLQAQENKLIDKVIGVVGKEIILQSDIENQYLQYGSQINKEGFDAKCQLLEDMLLQKMMLDQADKDSIIVTDAQVDGEMDRRLKYFASQLGSEQKVAEYFKKSLVEIKAEMRKSIKEMMLTQQVQSKITDAVKITPSEVRAFYNKLPKDSIPLVNTEVEISQIVRTPEITKAAKEEAFNRLKEIRERIINEGKDFGTQAALYSDDPGSRAKRGELDFFSRGVMYPEFEAVAFNLRDNEISNILESPAGYHIIQLIKRRGEQINVRHILIMPKVGTEELIAAEQKLDSAYNKIVAGSMTFAEAAEKYSTDESSKNGGVFVNPSTGATRFQFDVLQDMDPSMLIAVEKMQVGEMSKPTLIHTRDGKQAIRIVKLTYRSEPHAASLKDDYQLIQNAALENKKQNAINTWVEEKRKTTSVQIIGEYQGCLFKHKWL